MARAESGSVRRRELLVSGHINVDRFLRVDSFPAADRTVPVVEERTLLGGTAATIARVASSYGVETGLLSRVGSGFPLEFWKTLRAAHIDLSGVRRTSNRPTPTCYIVEDGRHAQRTLIQQGPMGLPRGAATPTSLLRRYAWLHLTTGNPRVHLSLARTAKRLGVRVAFDPAQEVHYLWDSAMLRQMLDGTEILFGNRHEIDRVTRLLGARRPEGLLRYVPLVVRTEGAAGASAFSRAGTAEADSARPRRVVSLVGSGDAFRGGFYAGWFAGEDLAHCLKAGTRAARHWIETGTERFGRSAPARN